MKWLIFVVLKAAELAAIVFVPYWVGIWLHSQTCDYPHLICTWLCGAVILLLLCLLGIAATVLCVVNLKWSETIKKKLFS